MTIKEIKQQYLHYADSFGGVNKFRVFDFGNDIGKAVIVVNYYFGCKDVIQIVRVSDGKRLLTDDRARPCDDLNDAVDVACEMLADNSDYTPEGSREWIEDIYNDWIKHHHE